MWSFKFTGKGAHSVATKKTNNFGLYDMHGNVEEMCADYYNAGYYVKSPANDPQGPAFDPGKVKVARGGSFREPPQVGRSAYRNALDPTLGHAHLGFRVVCVIPLPPE
jgi:formylglycine-generating enzyme